MFTPQSLLETLQGLPSTNRYLIAFSGGLDSTALLHALVSVRRKIPENLLAVHVDHGLHAESSVWASHCAAFCEQLDIPMVCEEVRLEPQSGDSLEAVAREARYAVFRRLMQNEDILFTAHHQNDQAETFLLNLMRGSGIRGLSAMPLIRRFADGYLARPLLELTRHALQQYAEEHQLQWIDDPSNAQTEFDRNFLRHEIIPKLEQRWPASVASIVTSAMHLSETTGLLDEECESLLRPMQLTDTIIDLNQLQQQPDSWQKLLIRHWIVALQLPSIPRKQLEEFLRQLRTGENKTPVVTWSGAELRRYRQRLYIGESLPSINSGQVINWDMHQPLELPEKLGQISMISGNKQRVTVRFRQEGDRIYSQGMHRPIKDTFQQLLIPPWLRGRIPLVCADNKILSVAGLLYADNVDFRIYWKNSLTI